RAAARLPQARLSRPLGGVLADDLRDARGNLAPVDVVGAGGEDGLGARPLRQLRARVIAHVDGDARREPDAQRVRRELARIERYAYRHALHDLDPVAGGVPR